MESIETSFCLPQYKYIYSYMSKNTPKGFEIKTDTMQNITVYNPSSHRESNNLVLFNVNMPYMVVTDIKDDKSAEFELVVYKDVISNKFVYKNGECIGIIRSKKEDSSKQYIEIISDNDNVESFLNKKMSLLNTNFEYIGYSTDDIDLPNTPMSFSWYTSSLPSYFSLGTDAYILCLVHFDSDKNQFDYVNTYIGSSKAIDSITRRYSYSFHRIN